ncbi:MAG: TerC family protein [Pseudomonadota bacterium]
MIETIAAGWMWAVFIVFVLAMLAVDLYVFGGRVAHRVTPREALAWSLVWVTLSFAFAGLLWWYLDGTAGREVANTKSLEFLTGYLIEKSLSVDNIFVFLMIFGYFAVPAEYQRRVLLYGVLGAIVLRAIMILAGVWIVSMFHWVLYLFGAFLVVTGIKMFLFAEHKPDLEKNPVLRWMRGHLRITPGFEGERFFAHRDGVRYVTPLLLVLVLVEVSDIVFAVDSIPAIFAITADPFIVFTSNIFAILGLRALYFLLADAADRFHLLKYGLALVLLFVGTKMLIAPWFKIPIAAALGTVAAIIVTSMVLSLVRTRKHSG